MFDLDFTSQKPRFDPQALSYGPAQSPSIQGVDFGLPATSNPATGNFDFALLESIAGFEPGSTNPGTSGAGPDMSPGFLDRTLEDGTKINGWGGMALGIGQGLVGGYLGMKQYGLAKDQLAQAKKEFELNYENQRKLTNAELADRQRARHATDPRNFESEAEYMKKYGV